jgi:hypothetical protein
MFTKIVNFVNQNKLICNSLIKIVNIDHITRKSDKILQMITKLLQKSVRDHGNSSIRSVSQQATGKLEGLKSLAQVFLNRNVVIGIVTVYSSYLLFMKAMFRGDTEEEQKIKQAHCVAVVGMLH